MSTAERNLKDPELENHAKYVKHIQEQPSIILWILANIINASKAILTAGAHESDRMLYLLDHFQPIIIELP